jgi:hypothetical protein
LAHTQRCNRSAVAALGAAWNSSSSNCAMELERERKFDPLVVDFLLYIIATARTKDVYELLRQALLAAWRIILCADIIRVETELVYFRTFSS